MQHLRPHRPVVISPLFPTRLTTTTTTTTIPRSFWTMSDRKQRPGASGSYPKPKTKEKRPPLTHFLCLPLVNAISLPQLESSLATFKAAIPSCPLEGRKNIPPDLLQLRPLIPDGALRPVGTLHLTLGVMSLPTKERLEEAIRFLGSLDLAAMMREAENTVSARSRNGIRSQQQSSTGEAEDGPSDQGIATQGGESGKESIGRPSPFTISLESLHALPRARSATVLHAAPVDSTSRLYPFCVMLRDKFLEAGFLQGERRDMNDKEDNNNNNNSNNNQDANDQQKQNSNNYYYNTREEEGSPLQELASNENTAAEKKSILEELPVDLGEEAVQQSWIPNVSKVERKPQTCKPKVRPLLLHATVVNTIYIKGRRGGGGNNNNDRRNNQYSFDARDVLDYYRDYYLDREGTQPRSARITVTTTNPTKPEEEDHQSDNNSHENGSSTTLPSSSSSHEDSSSSSSPGKKRKKKTPNNGVLLRRNPFVWARDFPLEKLCICEMGAKKLDADDHDGLGARLGEEYRVVASRSLMFDSDPFEGEDGSHENHHPPAKETMGLSGDQLTDASSSSDGSPEGGVKVL